MATPTNPESVWARNPGLYEEAVELHKNLGYGEIAALFRARGVDISRSAVRHKLRNRDLGPLVDAGKGAYIPQNLIEPRGGYHVPHVPPQIKHPQGWEPHVEENGDTATAISEPMETDTPDERMLIEGWKLDPNEWVIVGPVNCRRWQAIVPIRKEIVNEKEDGTTTKYWATIGYEKKWLHYFRGSLKRRGPGAIAANVKELAAFIHGYKRPAETPPAGEAAFVVPIADLQAGKGDGDGVTGTTRRMLDAIDRVVDRVRDLRKTGVGLGPLYVFGLGDIVEGCFAGETEVLTKTGVRRIADLAAEGRATLKTEYGKWVDAEVRSFGKQRLLKITLDRMNARKTVYATAEHRWFVHGDISHNSEKREKLTRDLQHGDYLAPVFGRHPAVPSPFGVARGYVFGDGHRNDKNRRDTGCVVNVHRRDFQILRYFCGCRQSEVLKYTPRPTNKLRITENSDYIQVSDCPSYFKELPDPSESVAYLFGWAAGYFAADGHVGHSVSISSANRSHLEFYAGVCARIGIGTQPITEATRMGVGPTPSKLYRLGLIASTIPDEFFVKDSQREQFEAMRSKISADGMYTFQKNRGRAWKVLSVEATEREEEVFCAVVPGTYSFALANDILTGNCGEFYAQQTFGVQLNRRDQVKLSTNLVLHALKTWSPLFERVVVSAIPGNHGENRKDGKSYTSFSDSDDLAIFEMVGMALAENPAFGHVAFSIPKDELTAVFDVCGTVTGLAHGHAFGKFGDAGKKAQDWWMRQSHGGQPIGRAQLLISGHLHHLLVTSAGFKTHIQCPALEGGSDWFRHMTGQEAAKGLLTMVVGKDVGPAIATDGSVRAGWDHLAVL